MIRRALLLAAATAVLLCALAAPAAAKGGQLFGISKGNQAPNAADFRKMRASSVHGYRFVINWRTLQPNPRSLPRFARISDHLIGNLAQRGIRPAPFVFGSPRWVGKPYQPPLSNPYEREAWRRFLISFVDRYGPGGNYWQRQVSNPAPGGEAEADHLDPDLERAQPGEVLSPAPGGPKVRAAGEALRPGDQRRQPLRQGGARGADRVRRPDRLELSCAACIG